MSKKKSQTLKPKCTNASPADHDEWKSAETAPKDGSVIRGYFGYPLYIELNVYWAVKSKMFGGPLVSYWADAKTGKEVVYNSPLIGRTEQRIHSWKPERRASERKKHA